MSTSFTPRGKAITLLVADESSFGTAPGGNWIQTFVYGWGKGGQRALDDDKLLGLTRTNDRDSTAPGPGLATYDGAGVIVPLDLAHFGLWLKGAFGASVDSGSSPNFTHVWTSGNEVLPTRSAELKLTSTWFRQDNGIIVAGLDFDMGRKSGYDRATARLMGQKTAKFTSTQGGTPAAPFARDPLPFTMGVAKINGTIAGRIRSFKATYDNKISEQDYVGFDFIPGFDLLDEATFTGTLGIRLLDSTFRDLATTGGPPGNPFSLEMLWSKASGRSLSILTPAARLALDGEPINGPGGIDVDYTFRAEQSSSAAMLTVTLQNAIASY